MKSICLVKKLLVLVSCVLILGLQGCETTNDPGTRYVGETEKQIYDAGLEAMRVGKYRAASSRFESLDALYPFGQYAQKEQLYSIYAYYKLEDMPSALAAADRYIHLYPSAPNVAYALYLRGIVNYQQHMNLLDKYFPTDLPQRDTLSAKQSFLDFQRVTRQFPKSRYTQSSYQYMAYLRNLLAMHQVRIADFYLQHKAYVGAVNRANEVVSHFQGAPANQQALQVLVLGYQGMGLKKLASNAEKVYYENFQSTIQGRVTPGTLAVYQHRPTPILPPLTL